MKEKQVYLNKYIKEHMRLEIKKSQIEEKLEDKDKQLIDLK